MAIHCLLERRRCSGTCLAFLLLQGVLHYRQAGRVIDVLPNGQLAPGPPGPTVIHAFPVRDTRRHHTSHLQLGALGHLGVWHPPDLVCCENCHGNTPEFTVTVYTAVTHRRDHKTRPAVGRYHVQQEDKAKSKSIVPDPLQEPGAAHWSRVPLGLSCHATVPSQAEICGAPHGWSTSPVSICFNHQWCMRACMDVPPQEASPTCSMQMPRGTCDVEASWLERQHPR